ncbi:DUF4142 domain-containing protein [Bradyrhizobium sp.]|uniref:DUF4142 domain-containing protein n=1 Tax=Bradyrhizobium sp. TaxID=376 RepID=UPI003C3690D9
MGQKLNKVLHDVNGGTSAYGSSLNHMRAALAVIVLVTATAAFADSETPGATTGRTPAGADVIAELYQFDLFEQNAIDGADLHGNEEVRNFAVAHADAAAKRDKALAELQRQTPIDVNFDDKAAGIGADRTASLDESEGPAFVRQFYQAQVAAYQSALALLERYLQAPDNDKVRSFASNQLPGFRAGLQDAQDALTDK